MIIEAPIPTAKIATVHAFASDGIIRINHDERMGFVAKCDPDNAIIQWDLYSQQDPSPNPSNFLLGQQKKVFIVKSGTILAGFTYTVRLHCLTKDVDGTDLVGASKAMVRLNQPPIGGQCSLCLVSGDKCTPMDNGAATAEVFDEVRLQCSGWTSADSPLTYTFGLSYDSGASVQWMPSQTSKAFYDLPCLNPGGTIVFFVLVKSSTGSAAVVEDGAGAIGGVTSSYTITVSAVRRRRSRLENDDWSTLMGLMESALQRGQSSLAVLVAGGAAINLNSDDPGGTADLHKRNQLVKVLLAASRQQWILTPGIICQVFGAARTTVSQAARVSGVLVYNVSDILSVLSKPTDLMQSKQPLQCGDDVAQVASSLIQVVSALNLSNPISNERGITEAAASHAMGLFEPALFNLMKIYTRDLVVDEDSRVIKSGDFGRHSVTRLSLADAVSRPQILSDAKSRTASVSIPRELGKEMVLAPNVIVDVHVNTHAVAPAIGAWKPNASIPVSPLVGVTLSREDDVTPLHIANLRKGNFSITIPLDVASGSRIEKVDGTFLLGVTCDVLGKCQVWRPLECLFWDGAKREYSGYGCRLIGAGLQSATCSCNHLSLFIVAKGPQLPPPPPPPPPPSPANPILSPRGLMVGQTYVRYVEISVMTNDKAVCTSQANVFPSCDVETDEKDLAGWPCRVAEQSIFVTRTSTITVAACRSGWVGGWLRSPASVISVVVVKGKRVILTLSVVGDNPYNKRRQVEAEVAFSLGLPPDLVEITQDVGRVDQSLRHISSSAFTAVTPGEHKAMARNRRAAASLTIHIELTPTFKTNAEALRQKVNALGKEGLSRLLVKAGVEASVQSVSAQDVGQDPEGTAFVDQALQNTAKDIDAEVRESKRMSDALLYSLCVLGAVAGALFCLAGVRCFFRYKKRKQSNKIVDASVAENILPMLPKESTAKFSFSRRAPPSPRFLFWTRRSSQVAPASKAIRLPSELEAHQPEPAENNHEHQALSVAQQTPPAARLASTTRAPPAAPSSSAWESFNASAGLGQSRVLLPAGLPQAPEPIRTPASGIRTRAGGLVALPPVRGTKIHEAVTPLTDYVPRTRQAQIPSQEGDVAGATSNITQDPQPSPSAAPPRKQVSLKSQETMRHMLADLRMSTGQGLTARRDSNVYKDMPAEMEGPPPVLEQSAWDKFLGEQSLRVPAAGGRARVDRIPPKSRASTPPEMPANLRPKPLSSPLPDSTSLWSSSRPRVLRSLPRADETRVTPATISRSAATLAAMPPPRAGWLAEGAEDRAATGPQTPAALAGARRPPVGHVLNLQATGSSPPQASAPRVAAVAAVEEEITREEDMSASGLHVDGTQQGLARMPSQPTSPKLGQGFPALELVTERHSE
jgi:hypothetical protein